MADERFYVKTLRMENFRCFEDVTLGPFDPHFNLLVGENGAGKSSALVALAQLFVQPFMNLPLQRVSSLVTESDIRIHYRETETGWEGPIQIFPCQLSATLRFGNTENMVGTRIAGPTTHNVFPMVTPYVGYNPHNVSDIIIFYRTQRRFISDATESVILSSSDSRILGYENWSDAGRDFASLRNWLKEETLLALQVEHRQKEGNAAVAGVRARLQLNLLQQAIVIAISDSLGLEYDAEVKDIVFRTNGGSRKYFSEMSDGQRAMIGLISDLVRRVCFLNGTLLGERALIDTAGLVLIDEIDLHLHPKWQRQIVPTLKRIFPKIQFFATTHSPQVIGECKPEEIVLLTPQGQERPAGSYGMDSNWILECVMRAEGRDPKIAERIKSLFEFIEQDRLEEAKKEILRLREELPAIAPEIVSAEAYIWNLEHGADEAAE